MRVAFIVLFPAISNSFWETVFTFISDQSGWWFLVKSKSGFLPHYCPNFCPMWLLAFAVNDNKTWSPPRNNFCSVISSLPHVCRKAHILWSVQFSHSVISDSLRPHGLQHARPPCSSPTPGACSNSCPLSRWCHQTISPSVIPFFSCLQPFPESWSFPVS